MSPVDVRSNAVHTPPRGNRRTGFKSDRSARSDRTAGWEIELPTNKQIMQAAYQAFAQGDVPAVLAVMDDKIEWTEADGFPLAGTYVGPQAVVDGVFMRLSEIGDDFAVTPTQFVAEDDTVVSMGAYSWKQRSTGQPVQVKMAHVWTLRDGKIISFQQHVDTLKVQELSA